MPIFARVLFLVLPLLWAGPVLAGHKKHGGLEVQDAFARATPGPVKNGAVYLTLKNDTMVDRRVVSAETTRAEKAELHTHIMENDIARMRRVDHVAAPKHGEAKFQPGGNHIMLMGLHGPLKMGEEFPLALILDGGTRVETTVAVIKPGGTKAHAGHGNMSPGSHGKKSSAGMEEVMVHRISQKGVHEMLGKVILMTTDHGLNLTPALKGLTPGPHAFHIHSNPDCGPGTKDSKPVAGLAAGGHLDLPGHAHGHGMKPEGDLPELLVNGMGHAMQPVTVKTLTLEQVRGRALMIHDSPEAKGGGGARVACGVIPG